MSRPHDVIGLVKKGIEERSFGPPQYQAENGCAALPPERNLNEIPRELITLRDRLDQQAKLIEILIEKLAPLIVPIPACESNQKNDTLSANSKLGQELQSLGDRVSYNNQSLQDLFTSLAL